MQVHIGKNRSIPGLKPSSEVFEKRNVLSWALGCEMQSAAYHRQWNLSSVKVYNLSVERMLPLFTYNFIVVQLISMRVREKKMNSVQKFAKFILYIQICLNPQKIS